MVLDRKSVKHLWILKQDNLTELSCWQIIVEGIHRVREAIDVKECSVIQRPVQTIGDVHAVKVFHYRVVREQGEERTLFPLYHSWPNFITHCT